MSWVSWVKAGLDPKEAASVSVEIRCPACLQMSCNHRNNQRPVHELTLIVSPNSTASPPVFVHKLDLYRDTK